MEGLVVKNTGSWYTVLTDDGQLIDSKIKGNFRLKGIRSTNPVAVGDRVKLVVNREGTAFISEIQDRRNYIIRKSQNLSKQSHIIAANVDMALLVVTVNYPQTSTTFIDRFLASAEAYAVPVALVFNKLDLYDADERRRLNAVIALYRHLGYPCFAVSATTGEGIADVPATAPVPDASALVSLPPLLPYLHGKTTLFSGNSGVGKSTLLNRLVPEARAKTAALSLAHDQGQHTTTFSEMYDLQGDARIIDTPGIRGFGTFDFNRTEVSHYFREIFAIGHDCRFSNCTHTHEPGCAVRTALDRHEIAESRYHSYLSILEDENESKYREKF